MHIVITGSFESVCLAIGKLFEKESIKYIDTELPYNNRDLHGLEGRIECARRMKTIKYSYAHNEVYISFQHYFNRTLVGNSLQGYDLMMTIHVNVPDVLDVKKTVVVPYHLVDEDKVMESLENKTFYDREFYDEEKLAELVGYEILRIIN